MSTLILKPAKRAKEDNRETRAGNRQELLAFTMIDSQTPSPGTVSKILWHFTGGPTWNLKNRRQSNQKKPSEQAYKNLKSIILERKLRVGQYKEYVNVRGPVVHVCDSNGKKIKIDKELPLTSCKVCCLADIPIIHLAYHATRYGKFAIGFHRDALVRAGFNPVLYTLPDTNVMNAVFEGFAQLESDELKNALKEIESGVSNIERLIKKTHESLDRVLAFVKSFDAREFSSVYCEREWRSVKDYDFDLDEVAMVVVPRSVGSRKYFKRFIERDAKSIKLPRSIPIVPWEDLVEH